MRARTFGTRSVEDPKSLISAELGVSIPEGFDVRVHEDSATTAHMLLRMTDRLTEGELAKVVAGLEVNWDTVDIS